MMKNTIYNSLKKEEKKRPCSMETIHKNGNNKNTSTDYERLNKAKEDNNEDAYNDTVDDILS